jgi:hypothetical protein
MILTDENTIDLTVRFWSRVEPFNVRRGDACAHWLGHRLPAGYGTLKDNQGATHYAHRVSWSLINGAIPEESVVRHKCDNPSCVRPSHLELGSQSENLSDRHKSGRTRVLPKLTDDDIVAIRSCYATGRWSQGDLAEMFFGTGSGQPAIQRIVSGRTYTNVGGPIAQGGRGKRPGRRRGD